MTDTTKAPKRPWRLNDRDATRILAERDRYGVRRLIAVADAVDGTKEEREAVAALIVKAVNAYGPTHTALKAAREYVHIGCMGGHNVPESTGDSPLCKQITAALAVAEGKVG